MRSGTMVPIPNECTCASWSMRTRKDSNRNNPVWNAHLSFSVDAGGETVQVPTEESILFLDRPKTIVVEVWDDEGGRFVGSTFFDVHWDADGRIRHPNQDALDRAAGTVGSGGPGGEGTRQQRSPSGGAGGGIPIPIHDTHGGKAGAVNVAVRVSLGMIKKDKGPLGGRTSGKEWGKADIDDWAALEGMVVEPFEVTVHKASIGDVRDTLGIDLAYDPIRHTREIVVSKFHDVRLTGTIGIDTAPDLVVGPLGPLQEAGVMVGDVLQVSESVRA